MQVAAYLDLLDEMVKSGGPNQADYETLTNAALELMYLSFEDKAKLFNILKPILNIDSMIGHTFLKPYGYPGDFELISKIYSKWISQDLKYQKWDNLYHSTDTAKAIRRRKQYFINQVNNVSSKCSSPLVLNLGSGPCIDVLEYMKKSSRSPVKFECVDMDARSIEFGTAVCDNYIDSLTFINTNVFTFKSKNEYDLIWSASLFDYFNDKLFIVLLKKYYKLLKKGGSLIVANFSEINPSRGLLQVLCQWDLKHRSAAQLVELALTVGISRKNIEIWSETTEVNLFLHVSK